MTFQSIPINTIKLIPINNQKTGVNSSFLMLNRIAINTKILIPTNIQKKLLVSLFKLICTDLFGFFYTRSLCLS